MTHLYLSNEEVSLLKQYGSHSPIELIRSKAQVVLLKSKNVGLSDIAFVINRNERTVQRWIHDFGQVRMSSIFSGLVGNENASKLTKAQKQEVKKVLNKPPSKTGLPVEFWSVPKLKEYISAQFGVVYESDISYHYLLRFAGLDLKYPDTLSPRRDEQLIKKRMREIKKQLKPLLKDPTWVVLASDETRLQLESEIRRAWLQKVKRTIVKTERSSEHQNYLGFLDQKTGVCQVLPINQGNQTETIRVLKIFMKQYPNKQVCVVWDNARWHKGKLIRAELAKKKHFSNLKLINFPPYAPDHNPIEHVWQFAKSKIANRSNAQFDTIKQSFLDSINNREFAYKI